MSLRTVLLNARLVSVEALDEAEARQNLYGADLLTHLLGGVAVSEGRLLSLLGDEYGLPTVSPGELPYATAAALALVSREAAVELTVYPMRLEDNELTVAVADPAAAQRLSAQLDLHAIRAIPHIALAPRVRQALARDYAFSLDPHSRAAVNRLTHGDTLEPTSAPPKASFPTFSQLPRPRSAPPFGFPDQWSDALTPTGGSLLAETARQPTVAAPSFAHDPLRPQTSRELWARDVVAVARPSTEPLTPRRGPYTIASFCEDLNRQRTPDDVLGTYAQFASQFFDYSALFTLRGKHARVRATRGRGAPLVEAGANRLQLEDYPLFDEIRTSGRWKLCSLVSEEPKLAELLDRKEERTGALLPVKVRDKVLLVLFGAYDNAPVTVDSLGELLAVESFVSQAFERAIHYRKMPSVPMGDFLPKPPHYERPPISLRVRALADALTDD